MAELRFGDYSAASMAKLLEPLKIGELTLKNRVIMAPLTRCRASGADGRTPNEMMLEYYVQRACAGLIITEATSVTPMGVGYPHTPGIWSAEHVEQWKKITTAVHKAGGLMFLQLWHVGRISDPEYLGGAQPVAPSAIAAEGHVNLLRPKRAFSTPRALEEKEIPGIIEAYRQGAANAKAAGFDGVEIHGANGYLLDQFLQDNSNHRTDRYGGSLENRARLMLEVTDAVVSVWGASRVGMHLSPRCDLSSMGDSNLAATFGYVAEQLGKRKIAFICARESQQAPRLGPDLKKKFGGLYIANEKLTPQTGAELLAKGEADAIAFGVFFLANPDLPKRIQVEAPLNAPVPQTFYSEGPVGYTDYPFLEG